MADTETDINRRTITAFINLMYVERNPAAAFERYASDDLREHNAMLPDGRTGAVDFLTKLYSDPRSTFEVQRVLVDGSLAAVHVRANPAGRPQLALADFYRFADGVIVEHWDVIQPVPENSVNPHPMF